MWRRATARYFAMIAAFLLLIPTLLWSAPNQLVGETVWRGEVVINRLQEVPRGSFLRVEPGTRIRVTDPEAKIIVNGSIEMSGTPSAPISVTAPDKWGGFELFHMTETASFTHVNFSGGFNAIATMKTAPVIRHCSFTKCDKGVNLVRESSAIIEDCVFINNDIGIDNAMKSTPVIRNNRFELNNGSGIACSNNTKGLIEKNRFIRNQQGMAVVKRFPDQIRDNLFEENKIGIFCNQVQNTPLIADNRFIRNETAIINFSFSYPKIAGNRFIENTTAIKNEQYGSPLLEKNLFQQNSTAVQNTKKSNPKVEQNQFTKNETALSCDYSSYPVARRNNFEGNTMAVSLGSYMSADWEDKNGSKAIIIEQARARNTQNPLIDKIPTRFNDYLDFSDNYWGKDTPLLSEADDSTNLPFFYDRADQPFQVYPGFGDEPYQTDTIRYRPWLNQPVSDAGPGK